MPHFRNTHRVAALACALLLSLTACSAPGGTKPTMAEGEDPQAIAVKVMQPEYGSVSRDTEFAGKLEAAESINVYPSTAAQVVKTYFVAGERVKQGDLLFEIDAEALQTAADLAYLQYGSALSNSETSLLNAEKNWNSAGRALVTAKDMEADAENAYTAATNAVASAKKKVEDAKAALLADAGNAALQAEVVAAEAAYAAAQTKLAEAARLVDTYETRTKNAREDANFARDTYELTKGDEDSGTPGTTYSAVEQARINYENAVKNLGKTKVYAPVSGVIAMKSVNESVMASPQSPAYVITSEGGHVVSFNLSEDAANALSIGDTVTVIYSGKEYPAVLLELSRQANASTGLYAAKAQPLQDLGTNHTGTAVKVRASTAKAADVLLLPLDVVEYDGNQPFVYVYRDGVAVRANLVTGMSTAEAIVVTAGITKQDYIITTWHPDLRDGAAVYNKDIAPASQQTEQPPQSETLTPPAQPGEREE